VAATFPASFCAHNRSVVPSRPKYLSDQGTREPASIAIAG
jgi:hypothetical protein